MVQFLEKTTYFPTKNADRKKSIVFWVADGSRVRVIVFGERLPYWNNQDWEGSEYSVRLQSTAILAEYMTKNTPNCA